MPFLAVEKDGTELVYDRKDGNEDGCHYQFIRLPPGTIEKITGRKLRHTEMPYQLVETKQTTT